MMIQETPPSDLIKHLQSDQYVSCYSCKWITVSSATARYFHGFSRTCIRICNYVALHYAIGMLIQFMSHVRIHDHCVNDSYVSD